LTAIAKFLNWPMKFMGEAMGLMKKLGGFILDGLKSLGKMVAEAGAGALREVTGALREIAGKLGEFADELLGKFGSKGATTAGSDVTGTLENDTASSVERDANAARNEGKPGEGKPNEGKPNEGPLSNEALKAEEIAEATLVARGITAGAQA